MIAGLLHALLVVAVGLGGPALVLGLPLWAFELGRRAHRRHAVARTRERAERISTIARSRMTEHALAELEADPTPWLQIGDHDLIDEGGAPPPVLSARSPSVESLLWALRAVSDCGIPDPRQHSAPLAIATNAVIASVLAEAGFGKEHPSWDAAEAACRRNAVYAAAPLLIAHN